jgi:hypothetical protein
MTRMDLAHLVLRTLALWVGMNGLASVVTALTQTGLADAPFALEWGGMFLVHGVVLWLLVPAVARVIFGRRSDDAAFHVTPQSVPPLAGFLVGFYMLAQAVPQAGALIGIQIFRNRAAATVMSDGGNLLGSLDERSVDLSITLVFQIIVGVVLLANSHRLSTWTSESADAQVDVDAE